jgi:serine phosphatase RsbU (regulator of sigma subunit)
MPLAAFAERFPWGRCALALAPAGLLIPVAAAVGATSSIGLATIAFAAVLHSAALALWVPRATAEEVGVAAAAATGFLDRTLDLVDVERVAGEFVTAVQQALGPVGAWLLVPSPDGGVRVLPRPTRPVDLGDAQSAFLSIGQSNEPLVRSELERRPGQASADVRELLDRLGGEVLLPLRHRDLLLGIAVIAAAPSTSDHAASFLRAMRAYTTVALANTFLDAETRTRQELHADLQLANAVQESLMPAERPVRRERFSLRGVFRPMAECGGDLWAWRELAGEKVLLVVADATGHGAGPALLAAIAKGAIDASWQLDSADLDPARLLTQLSRIIFRSGRQRYLMTAFALIVDTVSGELWFANAGQNFPLVLSQRGVDVLVARGDPLGSSPEASFVAHHRKLALGERILLFTDGIIDAGAPYREPFGERRFRAALAGQAELPAHRILDMLLRRIEDHLAGVSLGDDITAVVFALGNEAPS